MRLYGFLFLFVSCTNHVAPSAVPSATTSAVIHTKPPTISPPVVKLPSYKQFVVKPLKDEQALLERASPGPGFCETNEKVFCKKDEYTLTDSRSVVITKQPKALEERLFVYTDSNELDHTFHPNKRTRVGLSVLWKGQPFHVNGMVSMNEYFVLIGTTFPKSKQSAKKFHPRLVLKRYNANTGATLELSFAMPVSIDQNLQFVSVINKTKWVIGIQKNNENGKDDSTKLVVCQDWQCGETAGIKPYFDKKILEDHYLPLKQDRLLWIRGGEGGTEQLQRTAYHVSSTRKKEKTSGYEVIIKPQVTFPYLPQAAPWLDVITVQERVIYISQNINDLSHVQLGCIELHDKKSCEGTHQGHYVIDLSEPQQVHYASLALLSNGELGLELRGPHRQRIGSFAIGLPATREQLRLVEHPEETVLWWRNIGSQDHAQPSLLATAHAKNLSSLPTDLQESLQERSILFHNVTVPYALLKSWAEALLTQRKLDQPTYPPSTKGIWQVGYFHVYALQLCQGHQCWEQIPGSREEIWEWADTLLKEIPKDSVPKLRQNIQIIQGLAGHPLKSLDSQAQLLEP